MIGALAIKNGVCIEKRVLDGDDDKNLELVNRFAENHPNLTIEVHRPEDADWQTAFVDVVVVPEKTQAQKDWATFKATNPTALQAIVYLAKVIGLE